MNAHRARTVSRRWSGDGGAVLAEFALVFPLLMLFLLGTIDLGMVAFEAAQATNAARDGARVAILDYEQVDVVGSSDRAEVVTAVNERLAGRVPSSIDVSCEDADGATTSCATAEIDRDYVVVRVGWTYRNLTFVGERVGLGDVSGTSRMRIIGRPVVTGSPPTTATSTTTSTSTSTTSSTSTSTSTTSTTAAPNPCVGTVAPDRNQVAVEKGNGRLTSALTLRIDSLSGTCPTSFVVRYEKEPVAVPPQGSATFATADPRVFQIPQGADFGSFVARGATETFSCHVYDSFNTTSPLFTVSGCFTATRPN